VIAAHLADPDLERPAPADTDGLAVQPPVLGEHPEADSVEDLLGLAEVHRPSAGSVQQVEGHELAIGRDLDVADVLAVIVAQVVEELALGVGHGSAARCGAHVSTVAIGRRPAQRVLVGVLPRVPSIRAPHRLLRLLDQL
jgi:hypothetical protein